MQSESIFLKELNERFEETKRDPVDNSHMSQQIFSDGDSNKYPEKNPTSCLKKDFDSIPFYPAQSKPHSSNEMSLVVDTNEEQLKSKKEIPIKKNQSQLPSIQKLLEVNSYKMSCLISQVDSQKTNENKSSSHQGKLILLPILQPKINCPNSQNLQKLKEENFKLKKEIEKIKRDKNSQKEKNKIITFSQLAPISGFHSEAMFYYLSNEEENSFNPRKEIILFISQPVCNLLGLSPELIIGKKSCNFFPRDYTEQNYRQYEKVRKKKLISLIFFHPFFFQADGVFMPK